MTTTSAPAGLTHSRANLLNLWERMLLIRRVEERLGKEAAAGTLPGGVHLYIGQEAIAVGVCAHLTDDDLITSTHRGHGHFLAKGGDPKLMMAEIWAKDAGICRGMGGSMHVADLAKGILGANGIVGGGLAIATGAALALQLNSESRVAVAFFGDGAANQGVLMETMNLAALWRLPLVLVCEQNQFSEFTACASVTVGNFIDRAAAFGMPNEQVDGNDVTAVWHAAERAVARARAGHGPSFIEAITYRMRPHIESESAFLGGRTYRDEADAVKWAQHDPINHLREQLISAYPDAESAIGEIERRIAETIESAVGFALEAHDADPALIRSLMFDGQEP